MMRLCYIVIGDFTTTWLWIRDCLGLGSFTVTTLQERSNLSIKWSKRTKLQSDYEKLDKDSINQKHRSWRISSMLNSRLQNVDNRLPLKADKTQVLLDAMKIIPLLVMKAKSIMNQEGVKQVEFPCKAKELRSKEAVEYKQVKL